ncbi:MAG: hypothetical protein COU90_03220 [Candidatus Ryanbacteria bacterium CG10_big_fil_rev_8_21_14_0_10_43_42]|uniref:DUF11 domain-containing protein n=1 Tax=Candidatus Ryanbacteria bacterium CG10_big_fil_rev_8_21_14_0_10_43_42 TaxID=1974864 RepID=A0A2M8KX18_9BACT|nr:MAG: hypothetical protein COU90_03220 [Candidatus Ryanbacteria bacterium CG10_big_fil_rev_8_21_14_0_10_43_42]
MKYLTVICSVGILFFIFSFVFTAYAESASLSHRGEPVVFSDVGTRNEQNVTMRGMVRPEGKSTIAWFEWGLSPDSLPNATPGISLDAASSWQGYSYNITSIIIPVYYRSVAYNENGISRGGIVTTDYGYVLSEEKDEVFIQPDNNPCVCDFSGSDMPLEKVSEWDIEKDIRLSGNSIITYAIHVTNKGPKELHDIVITDTLAFSVPPPILSISDKGVYSKKDKTVLWTINRMESHETRILMYVVAVDEHEPYAILAGGQTTLKQNDTSFKVSTSTISTSSGTYEYIYEEQSTDSGIAGKHILSPPSRKASFFSGFIGMAIGGLGILLIFLLISLGGIIAYEKRLNRLRA